MHLFVYIFLFIILFLIIYIEGIGKYLLDVLLKQKTKYWNDDNVHFAVGFRLNILCLLIE